MVVGLGLNGFEKIVFFFPHLLIILFINSRGSDIEKSSVDFGQSGGVFSDFGCFLCVCILIFDCFTSV